MNIKYKQIDFLAGSTIEDAVERLRSYKDKGILAKGIFNGNTLYSDTITIDGAYKKIMGKTKKEFDISQQKSRDLYKKKEREHKEKISDLILEWQKKGREVLTNSNWLYWDIIVPIRLNDIYEGIELSHCLNIIKILNNNGTFAEAKEEIENQNHSGMSFGLVCSMIKEFCSRGNEFVDYIS